MICCKPSVDRRGISSYLYRSLPGWMTSRRATCPSWSDLREAAAQPEPLTLEEADSLKDSERLQQSALPSHGEDSVVGAAWFFDKKATFGDKRKNSVFMCVCLARRSLSHGPSAGNLSHCWCLCNMWFLPLLLVGLLGHMALSGSCDHKLSACRASLHLITDGNFRYKKKAMRSGSAALCPKHAPLSHSCQQSLGSCLYSCWRL